MDGNDYCSSAEEIEGKEWANDVMKQDWAEGYENPWLDESTERGANPEADARGEEHST